MKCRELMVGDWIANENKFPMQITCVGDDYAYATFEGLEGDPWEFDNRDYQPQPIEITKELFETNGWKEYSYTLLTNIKEHFYVKDEGDMHLEFKGDTLTIWLTYEKYNDGIYSDIRVPCKYVHQLQQALRLAGMTDMANNFKI